MMMICLLGVYPSASSTFPSLQLQCHGAIFLNLWYFSYRAMNETLDRFSGRSLAVEL